MALTRPKYSQIFDSDFKNSARVATTTNVTLSGAAPLVVDGITLAVKDRVLVRSQTSASQNGIYVVTTAGTGSNGTWTRAQDADTGTKLTPGTTLSVEEGSTLGGNLYRMTSTGTITIGSTAINWTDVSGGGGSASGNNGQIQFNDTNAFSGSTYLYYNKTTGQVTANAGIASSSTTTGTMIVTGGVGISGALYVGSNTVLSGDMAVNGGDITTTATTVTHYNTNATTASAYGAAAALTFGATTGTMTLRNPTIVGSQTTQNLFNTVATTLNLGGAATALTIGATTGTTTIRNALTVTGNLTVNGTTTTVNATTLTVDDKNIELGSVASPTDVTADGGGITLKGATDKTILWSTTGWTSSEDWNLATGKQYEINGTAVLSATTLGSGVTASSLTSVGTITSGTWSGLFGAVSGANLTTLNASNLASGTVPDARITGSYTGMTNLTGTGTVDFAKFLGNAADTVTAPSFSWTGDDNTGMYQPAADQIGFACGGVQELLVTATGINIAGSADTATAASHYYVETASDGYVRPKTLASVKTEIVTTAAVNAAAATTVGTVTSGTWSATTIATNKGGTGLTAFTSGGAVYASSTSALTTGTLPVASGGTGVTTSTGTGSVVLNTSPSLTTPAIGAATGTSLILTGTLSAASKSFLIPHPTKPGKTLRYGSLEGPENGVYVRGRLTDNNTIELPEYWTKLVDPDSITVTLTPIGRHQNLFVESVADNKVVVGNSNLVNKNIDCFFVVYGERVDIDKLLVEE